MITISFDRDTEVTMNKSIVLYPCVAVDQFSSHFLDLNISSYKRLSENKANIPWQRQNKSGHKCSDS